MHEDGAGGDGAQRRVLDLMRVLTVETDRFVERRGSERGLHRTHLHALAHVLQAQQGGDALTPGRLAHALNLSAPATTALLDRLEAAGHVVRGASPRDGRSVHLTMTPAARDVAIELFGPLADRLAPVLDDLDDAELAVVLRFLSASVVAITAAVDGAG